MKKQEKNWIPFSKQYPYKALGPPFWSNIEDQRQWDWIMAQETLFTSWGIVVLDVDGAGVHDYLYWSLLLLLIHGTPMSKIFIWERGRSWNELMAVSPWVQLSELELKDWCYSLCSRILWVERDLRNNLIHPPLSLLISFPPCPSSPLTPQR